MESTTTTSSGVSTDTSMTGASTTTHKSQEDFVIFGSLNETIADCFSDSVEAVLTQGVASLPLVEKQQTLLSRLLRPYMKNIDIFELYTKRNVFTISMFPPKRRQTIVDMFTNGFEETSSSSSSPLKDTENETTDDTGLPSSAKDIPSHEQMLALEEETKKLREELKLAKRKRTQVLKALKELEVAEQLTIMANQSVDIENVQNSVSTAVKVTEGLGHLQKHGKELVKKMREKRQQVGEDVASPSVSVPKKQKEMSLEERYQQEKLALGASTKTLEKLRSVISASTSN